MATVFQHASSIYYTVSQENCAKLFMSELRHISTNFDNFWQNDDKEAKIMRGALTFHLPLWLRHCFYESC